MVMRTVCLFLCLLLGDVSLAATGLSADDAPSAPSWLTPKKDAFKAYPYVEKAQRLIAAGKYDDARTELDTALSITPQSGQARWMLMNLLAEQAKNADAPYALYATALSHGLYLYEQHADNPELLRILVTLLSAQYAHTDNNGNLAAIRGRAHSLLVAHPQNPDLLWLLMRLSMAQADTSSSPQVFLEEALRYALRLHAVRADSPELYFYTAHIYRLLHRPEDALRQLHRISRLPAATKQDTVRALREEAELENARGNAARAAGLFAQAAAGRREMRWS